MSPLLQMAIGIYLVIAGITTFQLANKYRKLGFPRSTGTIEGLACIGLGLIWPWTRREIARREQQ